MIFENIDVFFEKIKVMMFENDIDINSETIIWGAGETGQRIYEHINHLRPKYFVDGNEKLIGKQFGTLEVISPSNFFEIYNNEKIIIAAVKFYDEIEDTIVKNNIDIKNIFFADVINYAYAKIVLENSDKIRKVYSLLEDKKSKDTFLSTIFSEICIDIFVDKQIIDTNRQYFDNELIGYPGDYFVDAGACDGIGSSVDFVSIYEKKFKKLYSFEPTEEMYLKLKNNLSSFDSNKIDIFNIGILDEEKTLHFKIIENLNPGNRISEDGEVSINVNSLDNVLSNKPVDFIKMDIEGSEIKALDGAKVIITENNPKLAICTYHTDIDNGNYTHFWEVPLKINEINNKYKLYIRHHSTMTFETVCYAII